MASACLVIEPPGANTVGTAPMIVVSDWRAGLKKSGDKFGPYEIRSSGALGDGVTVYFLTTRHIWIFPP